MEKKILGLISNLREKNKERSERINSGTLSEYNHTVAVHLYNHTLEIIKELENTLK